MALFWKLAYTIEGSLAIKYMKKMGDKDFSEFY